MRSPFLPSFVPFDVNLYALYEASLAALVPARAVADAVGLGFRNPANPLSHTLLGRNIVAAAEMFERTTRRYAKPAFGFTTATVDGAPRAVTEREVWASPFCRVIRFERALPEGANPGPRLLIVAPMSGHYATLLRGTVEAFLPTHDVHITDWTDARAVPLSAGRFDLDDYVDHVRDVLRHLGPGTHVMAVCQPAVPVAAAAALMDEDGDPCAPRSMTLMGGPIDTRCSPTAVNTFAESRGMQWFRDNCIVTVPFPHPGVGRRVYPGFLQLSGFMAMNIDRHRAAHREMFQHLVQGDDDSAEKHREFYDEYLAVMDMTEEFYLQTIETVFVRHLLPKGEMHVRGRRVDLGALRNVGVLTVEGERDDISGVGQTRATLDLAVNLPDDLKAHHLQEKVGHYGVFNGRRYREAIAPRIAAFMAHTDARAARGAGRPRLVAAE